MKNLEIKNLEDAIERLDAAIVEKEDARQNLADSIRPVRQAKGITLREAARQIGVSAAFLSDVELGRRFPNDKIIDFLLK